MRGLPGTSLARGRDVPPVGRGKPREVFGQVRVFDRVIVNGGAGFRGRLSPNGPPSPRLAPGGFYGKGDWLRAKRGACTLFQSAHGIRVREG